MQAEQLVRRAMVIDCDVHQGNGTAHIFAHTPEVFTFSIHQEYLYPSLKQRSDLDIGLPDRAGDQTYLQHIRDLIPGLIKSHKPELIIYVAGADPYVGDVLGSLQLSMGGLRERDFLVLSAAAKARVPIVTVTAGGYTQCLEDTVSIHAQTCKTAIELVQDMD